MSEKREPVTWITRGGKHIPIYADQASEDEQKKEREISNNEQEALKKKNAEEKESWRDKDPKYQKKTEGGVYFYANDSKWGQHIDEKMYNKLPKYIKKSVVMIESRKTGDGNHCEIYYIDKDGKIQWFDEYGMGDFLYSLKSTPKSDFGLASDWEYDSDYREGRQLKQK